MPIKKTILIIFFSFAFNNFLNAEENLKSTGKFKDWESFVLVKEEGKVCFAQSIPIVRAPKKLKEMSLDYLLVLDQQKILKMKLVLLMVTSLN